MSRQEPTTPTGKHLEQCLLAPGEALESAARGTIPFGETLAVATMGLAGLATAALGVTEAMPAAEQLGRGVGLGLASWIPMLVFLGATNALQPATDRPVPFRRSLEIGATALVLPGLLGMVGGLLALVLPALVAPDAVEMVRVGVAAGTGTLWLLGAVAQVGLGHGKTPGGSAATGLAAAVGALMIVGFGLALIGWVLADPPWAKEQPMSFIE